MHRNVGGLLSVLYDDGVAPNERAPGAAEVDILAFPRLGRAAEARRKCIRPVRPATQACPQSSSSQYPWLRQVLESAVISVSASCDR